MKMDNWKNKVKSIEEYDKILSEMAENAPKTEEELKAAIKEFEQEWDAMNEEEKNEVRRELEKAEALARGDFSSLDSKLRKRCEELRRQAERKKQTKQKKISQKSVKRKEAQI